MSGAVGVRFTGDRLPCLLDEAQSDGRVAHVRRVTRAELDDRWSSASRPRRLYETYDHDRTRFLTVQSDPASGFYVAAPGHGVHVVAPGGSGVLSAMDDPPSWRDMRLVASQVLPLVAGLQGLEVLHAGGVVLAGRLYGLVAAAGTGKTSTLCHLVGLGATFFADDVLALERREDGTVVAHPGPLLLNVYEHELRQVGAEGRERLGPEVGRSGKVHVAPLAGARAMPLAGLLFLDRGEAAEATAIEPLDRPGPSLLAGTYLAYLDSRARLIRQLDLAAAVTAAVPLWRVRVGAADGAAQVARHIHSWVTSRS